MFGGRHVFFYRWQFSFATGGVRWCMNEIKNTKGYRELKLPISNFCWVDPPKVPCLTAGHGSQLPQDNSYTMHSPSQQSQCHEKIGKFPL